MFSIGVKIFAFHNHITSVRIIIAKIFELDLPQQPPALLDKKPSVLDNAKKVSNLKMQQPHPNKV